MFKSIIPLLFLGLIFVSCETSNKKPDTKEEKVAMNDTSDITCPSCGYTETEVLPTDQCQIKYSCKHCNYTMTPQGDDCCVYCSYGNHKCPSKQE